MKFTITVAFLLTSYLCKLASAYGDATTFEQALYRKTHLRCQCETRGCDMEDAYTGLHLLEKTDVMGTLIKCGTQAMGVCFCFNTEYNANHGIFVNGVKQKYRNTLLTKVQSFRKNITSVHRQQLKEWEDQQNQEGRTTEENLLRRREMAHVQKRQLGLIVGSIIMKSVSSLLSRIF